jgi:hypothetical protein
MIRAKHKSEREQERREREREGKKRFSFFSLEEEKWLVEMETREASTHAIGNKKQEKMGGQKEEFFV